MALALSDALTGKIVFSNNKCGGNGLYVFMGKTAGKETEEVITVVIKKVKRIKAGSKKSKREEALLEYVAAELGPEEDAQEEEIMESK